MSEQKRPGEVPLPKCKAMLICDNIIVEQDTGKHTLVGITSTLTIGSASGHVRPFCLFMQMTGGIGSYDVRMKFLDLSSGDELPIDAGGMLPFPDRMEVCNAAMRFPRFAFPHAGDYDLIVLADGKEIDRQRVTVGLGHG